MIVMGISDAVAETIVDLGINWDDVATVSDLQTGLRVALSRMNEGNANDRRGSSARVE
jgi:hypothetical protein